MRASKGEPLPTKDQYDPDFDLGTAVAMMMGDSTVLETRKRIRKAYILVPDFFKTRAATAGDKIRKAGQKVKDAVMPKSQQVAKEKTRGPLF